MTILKMIKKALTKDRIPLKVEWWRKRQEARNKVCPRCGKKLGDHIWEENDLDSWKNGRQDAYCKDKPKEKK